MLGPLLIKLNVWVAVYRRNSIIRDWPLLEVIACAAVTACLSYLVRYELSTLRIVKSKMRGLKVIFLRVQSSELVANLFQDCDPALRDYHGLCK